MTEEFVWRNSEKAEKAVSFIILSVCACARKNEIIVISRYALMEPKPKLTNQDLLDRVSYLAQASHLVVGFNENLARMYGSTLRRVAQKSVLRLHPSVKHSLCPVCDSTLVPGATASVRIESGSDTRAVLSCAHCGFARRFKSRSKRRTAPAAAVAVVVAQPAPQ
jgi:RNase P subunit RPR2